MNIYLDHNSTTSIDARVADTIRDYHGADYANPASQHRPGQRARRQLEQFRSSIIERLGGQAVGMESDTLVFTSGGTESNNLALFGLAQWVRDRQRKQTKNVEKLPNQVLVSAIEHPSILNAIHPLQQLGFEVKTIPVDNQGVCQLEALADMLQQPTLLVSLMLANHETGVIQPVAQAAELCRENGVPVHTDAVQAIGKMSVNFRQLGVDALSFTAHKFNGPRGIGGLLLRHGLNPHPMLYGGFQQMGIRPGTEDVVLVAGMDKALELFTNDSEMNSQTEELRNRLELILADQVDGLVINGSPSLRIPNTINFSIPGLDRQSFLLAADMDGLAISTGSACASGSSEPSSVLVAMGLPAEVFESAIRISLGISNSPAEIEEAGRRIISIINRLR